MELSSIFSLDCFRVCGRCSTPSLQPVWLFCRFCLSGLALHTPNAILEIPGEAYRVYSLYGWDDRTDPYVRPLVYTMKGGARKRAFAEFAGAFSWKLAQSGRTELRSLVFVPPPRIRRHPDHGYRWAEALASIWRAPLLDVLRFDGDSAQPRQKRLNVAERSRRTFYAEFFPGVQRESTIVFADDVFTTGATARAAYEALGKPYRFEVWTLAYRRKLAGTRAI